MFVSCECCVLSGRGLCDGLIPRPEESYRLWCVSECDKVKINNLDTYCEWVEEGRATKRSVCTVHERASVNNKDKVKFTILTCHEATGGRGGRDIARLFL
jgi:hypothetical protein